MCVSRHLFIAIFFPCLLLTIYISVLQLWKKHLRKSPQGNARYISPFTAFFLLSAHSSVDKALGTAVWSLWEATGNNEKKDANKTDGVSHDSSSGIHELLDAIASLEKYVSSLDPFTNLLIDPQFVTIWRQLVISRPEVADVFAIGRLLSNQSSFNQKSLDQWLYTRPPNKSSELPVSPLSTSQFLTATFAIRLVLGLRQVEYLTLTPYQAHYIARKLPGINSKEKRGGGGPCQFLSSSIVNKDNNSSSHMDDGTSRNRNSDLMSDEISLEVDGEFTITLIDGERPKQRDDQSDVCLAEDSKLLSNAWNSLNEAQQILFPSLTPSLGHTSNTALALKSQLVSRASTKTIEDQFDSLMECMASSPSMMTRISIDTDPPVSLNVCGGVEAGDRSLENGVSLHDQLPTLRIPQFPSFSSESKVKPAVPIANGTRKRFILLGRNLWDIEIPLNGCDPNIVDSLRQCTTSREVPNREVPNRELDVGMSTRTTSSMKERRSLDIPMDDFVSRQCAFHLSLFNKIVIDLRRSKQLYVDAILSEEELPSRLMDVPAVIPSINALFLMGVRWGKVSSHLIWGLCDQPDPDFILPNSQPKEVEKGQVKGLEDNKMVKNSPPLPTSRQVGSSAGVDHLAVPGGHFGSPIVPLFDLLRNMNSSDVGRSVIRPYESAASLIIPLPPFAVGAGRVRTCSVCFGAEWDGVNAILTCMQCHCCVHKGCYGVTDTTLDSETDNWMCKRCEYEKRRSGTEGFISGSLRCELCNTLGGALKRTMDDRWVHLTCALMLLPEVVPTDLQVLDNWNIRGIQPWRTGVDCSVCSVNHLADKTGDEGSGVKQTYHLDCYPLRLSEAPPHLPICQFVTTRRGACLRCSHSGCTKTFHPMCAWLAGMYLSVTRRKDKFYPWTQTIDQIYFPVIEVSVFCFDHAPQTPVPGSLRDHQLPTYRSAGYQRCLRHRRYINRDLYPHLCTPGNKRSGGRIESPVIAAGGLGGTPFSFAYAADSDSQQVARDSNNLNNGVKLLPPALDLGPTADVKTSDSVPNSTGTSKTELPAGCQMLINRIAKIEPTAMTHLPNVSHFESDENGDRSLDNKDVNKIEDVVTDQNSIETYLTPVQAYGVDPIDPVDPNSVYLIGKTSTVDRRITLTPDPSTLLKLTFPKPNELTPFPDKYCDRFCAVCFCRSEPSSNGSELDLVDPSVRRMQRNIQRHVSRLVRCRRCGLTVHPTCYGTTYPTESQLRPCLGLSSTRSENAEQGSRLLAQLDSSSEEEDDGKFVCRATATGSVPRKSSTNGSHQTAHESERLDGPDEYHLDNSVNHPSVSSCSEVEISKFTCEVCSSCHLIDDITCLLCSRRCGALKAIRLSLDWTPIQDDDDLNDFNTTTRTPHNPSNSAIVYAHVTCLLYCPGVTVGSCDTFQPIKGLERVVRSLLYGAHPCEICTSHRGVCLPCSQPECSKFFHPLCAQLHGCVIEQRVEGSGVSSVGYCKDHSSRLASESIPLAVLDNLKGLLEKVTLCSTSIQHHGIIDL